MLPLPNLDDRTFLDLTVELRSLIRRYDKAWTNHNPSDPGITVIELLAWLGEMLLYRMNRIEPRTCLTFLQLMGIEPASPRTIVTFELAVGQGDLPLEFELPRGTRVLARDRTTGRDIAFETTAASAYDGRNWDESRHLWIFKAPAVNTVLVTRELLGLSTGAAHQEFPVAGRSIVLAADDEAFAGNPAVLVDDGEHLEAWTYAADLLSAGADRCFTAEPLSGLIVFGDGTRGLIPPHGARILCTYRRPGGSAANVAAGTIDTLAEPVPGLAMAAVRVVNEYAATGGTDSETLDDLLSRGLASLLEPYRAVADADFEHLALQAVPGKVSRVRVVADRNLEHTTPDEEGHVSVIVTPALEPLGLRQAPASYDAASGTFALHRTLAELSAALDTGAVRQLLQQVQRFLDERRLITTVVHAVASPFKSLRLQVTLQVGKGLDPEQIKKSVGLELATFLDPYQGWEDREGWPFGRPVYRAELYQRVESVFGVDHVSRLTMNEDATTSLISVGEHDLVALDQLAIITA